MRFGLNYIAPLLMTGAAALAIASAPAATAASQSPDHVQQSCADLGASHSECQAPGNAQVYDAPPQVDYFPYAGGGT
jgi:hypothetical protein